jgi:hypothetical protein
MGKPRAEVVRFAVGGPAARRRPPPLRVRAVGRSEPTTSAPR